MGTGPMVQVDRLRSETARCAELVPSLASRGDEVAMVRLDGEE